MKRSGVVLGLLAAIAVIVLPACGGLAIAPAPALGTPQNPIKMAQVPYVESQRLLVGMQPFVDAVEKETGYKIQSSVATSYAAVVEAMGSEKVDIAWLATFAYVLARQKYGVEIILSSLQRDGKFYRGMIIARADAGIATLDDLKGKRFAWVDPASASGYLYPAALLAERTSFDPKKPTEFFSQQVFAGGHDKVVVALMNGQVDAGAIFDDARDNKSLLQMWPNLMQETKVVAQTDSIPSDTVSVRKGLPKEMVDKLKAAFLKVGNSEEGRQLLREVLGTYGLTEATDADYDPVRRAAKVLNLNLEEELAKPR